MADLRATELTMVIERLRREVVVQADDVGVVDLAPGLEALGVGREGHGGQAA